MEADQHPSSATEGMLVLYLHASYLTSASVGGASATHASNPASSGFSSGLSAHAASC